MQRQAALWVLHFPLIKKIMYSELLCQTWRQFCLIIRRMEALVWRLKEKFGFNMIPNSGSRRFCSTGTRSGQTAIWRRIEASGKHHFPPQQLNDIDFKDCSRQEKWELNISLDASTKQSYSWKLSCCITRIFQVVKYGPRCCLSNQSSVGEGCTKFFHWKKRLSSSAWCFLRICWRSIFSNLRWMKTNWVAEFRPFRAIFHWAVWFGKLMDTAFEKRTRWRHLLWKPQLVVLYTGLYCSFIWGLQQMPLQACCHSPTSFVATALLILWFRCPLERRLRCWLLRTAVHAAVVHGSPGFL